MENENNKKPRVIPEIPKEDLIKLANETGDAIAKQFMEENEDIKPLMSEKEYAAAMEMAKKRDYEKMKVENGGTIVRPELAEKVINDGLEISYGGNEVKTEPKVVSQKPNVEPMSSQTMGVNKPNLDDYIKPTKVVIDEPYDLIPLPSEGLIYPHKKTHIKVSYMNASDEDILTNPNLLQSGKMLDVLFERKIKEEGIDYKDLHVGDRNAIMLWLRATAYGNDYPVELYDPKTEEPFNMVVDLSELKTKNLKEKPDQNGLFTFKLSTGGEIKFKLLTIRDEEAIEDHVAGLKDSGTYDVNTFTLKKHIVEVDGNNDREYVEKFVDIMRIVDSRKLKQKINDIESGIDMRINVKTPGGESITTFLPLNLSFFWPDFGA